MPGKLETSPIGGALGILASAYCYSDDEDEQSDREVCSSNEIKKPDKTTLDSLDQHMNGTEGMVKMEDQLNVKTQNDVKLVEAMEILSSVEPSVPTISPAPAPKNIPDSDCQIIKELKYDTAPFTSAQANAQSKGDVETSDSEPESEDDSLFSDDSDESSNNTSTKKKSAKRQPPRVNGEILISELPPIEDLHISVPQEECENIGAIKSVVDSLVVVESYPGSAALDLDTVLFLDKGDRALGHVFDVFGPVKHPHYCVRFNSKDHISSRGVQIGMPVYCAPKSEYTKFVFLAQLRLLRGTDASWLDDIEPPPEELDYSDDEAEKGVNGVGGTVGNGGIPGRGGGRRGRRNCGGGASVNPNVNTPDLADSQPSNGSNGRGRKRSANFNPSYTGTNGFGGRGFPFQAPERSPYIPPYVPGFFPPSGYQGYGGRYPYPPPRISNYSGPRTSRPYYPGPYDSASNSPRYNNFYPTMRNPYFPPQLTQYRNSYGTPPPPPDYPRPPSIRLPPPRLAIANSSPQGSK